MAQQPVILTYQREKEQIERFLTSFETKNEHGELTYKYMDILKKVANRHIKEVRFSLDDMLQFDASLNGLIVQIEKNTLRYVDIIYSVVDEIMPASDAARIDDVIDTLWESRQERRRLLREQEVANADGTEPIPDDSDAYLKKLARRYEVYILPRHSTKHLALRAIKAQFIGHLIRVKGMVTRATEVKPMMTVATYTCENCGYEIFQEVTSRTFLPLSTCPTRICQTNHSGSLLMLQTRGSKFVKYQELRIQELPDQVPIGHIPRTMTVYVKGELCRSCGPGDIVNISGVFLSTPHSGGHNRYKSGLFLANLYLEAMDIEQQKKTYSNYDLSPEMVEQVNRFSSEPDGYTRLARSIAPEIFGCEDIKKALLLLMVGGVSRNLRDGMSIRGDINICLMGDPGVAKSQLLKHLATIAPRGIYTSGKGSSGVGLTAAVLRDPLTGELVLEGGSLVLADKGICCIDEFDKMDDADRTAIHEVMEQQTISIAKAGITTTLNARTAILAAANPAYGRYNTRKSPTENINLPAALLSRFDLLFLVLDKPDLDSDVALAEHVSYVHKHGVHPPLATDALSEDFIRAFVSEARKHQPYVPKELSEYIVTAYTNMRQEESQAEEEFTYTTARTLLAILRLASALARVRFDDTVTQADVDEAMRLLHVSKISLLDDKHSKDSGTDPVSAIFEIIRAIGNQKVEAHPAIAYDEILPKIVAKGFTQQQLDQCLNEYEALNVWQLSHNRQQIRLVS